MSRHIGDYIKDAGCLTSSTIPVVVLKSEVGEFQVVWNAAVEKYWGLGGVFAQPYGKWWHIKTSKGKSGPAIPGEGTSAVFLCVHKSWLEEGLVKTHLTQTKRTWTHGQCHQRERRKYFYSGIFPEEFFFLDFNKKIEAKVSPKTCWQLCVPSWLNYSSRIIKLDLEVLPYQAEQKRFWVLCTVEQ